MVVFRVDIARRHGIQNIKDLVDLLQKSKRETDILGYLGEERLALLLPDTREEGAHAVTRNLRRPGGRPELLDYHRHLSGPAFRQPDGGTPAADGGVPAVSR